MFTTSSVVANVWADAVRKEEIKIEKVPDVSNLRDIVKKIIKGDVPNV